MLLTIPILLVSLAGAPPVDPPRERPTIHRRVQVMGTWLALEVEATDRARALLATEAAITAVDEVERRLSTWRPESELSRFNRSEPGTWVPVSPELGRDLTRAENLTRISGGAFHLATGALVRAWDLRGSGRRPSSLEIRQARPSFPDLGLEIGDGRARRDHAGVVVEEGGFGKGIALEAAVAAATAAGAVCTTLDLGGQVLRSTGCSPATVGLAHPAHRARVVAHLTVTSGSVATSGASERSLEVEGVRQHHVLDPRTGLPTTFPGSATVLADDPVAADALATALVVLGWGEGRSWLAANPTVEAVLINEVDGRLVLAATAGAVKLLVLADPDARVETIARASPTGGPDHP